MTARTAGHMKLRARTATLLALAGALASTAAAMPATAGAFNPQPDPPGRTAAQSVSSFDAGVHPRGLPDLETGGVSDSEAAAYGGTNVVQDSKLVVDGGQDARIRDEVN